MATGIFWTPNDIIDRKDLSATEKLVYICLCRRANAEGKSFPAYKRIAADAGVCRRTAIRAIQRLVEIGLVVMQRRRRDNGGFTSNLYTITKYVTRGSATGKRHNKDKSNIKYKDKHQPQVNDEKRKLIQSFYRS